MAALPKSSVVVRFGKLDQKRAAKNHMLGTLEQAINVRQRELGRHSSRYGYTSIDRTASSGTITDAIAFGSNDGSQVLQTSSAIYLRDATSSTWRHKGAHTTVMPGATDVANFDNGTTPTHCIISGKRYEMTAVSSALTTAPVLHYRVVDVATGIELSGWQSIGEGGWQPRIISAGGFAWLLYVKADRQAIRVAKFNPSAPSTVPTPSEFLATVLGILGFDAFIPSGGTLIHTVVATASAANETFINQLDVATSLPTATSLSANRLTGNGGLCAWLHGSGADGSIWFVQEDASNNDLMLTQIDATTLAVTSTGGLTINASTCWGLTGYQSGTEKVVFSTSYAALANVEDAVVTRSSKIGGGAVTSTVFARAAWVASQPFQVGSSWFVVTGHDDVVSGTGLADNLQRSYCVRDASSLLTNTNIMARCLYGIGGDAWQRGNTSAAALYSNAFDTGFHTQVSVSGTTATLMLNGLIGTANSYDYAAYRQTFAFGESLGSTLANVNQSETIFAGGWGKRLVSEALLTDLVPMMFPTRISAAVSAGGAISAGVYGIAVVYKITDPRGYVSRSAPATTTATTAGGNLTIAVTIPYLRQLSSNTNCTIEVYATTINGALHLLHETIANVPTSDSVTRTYTTAFLAGEAIYTGGGVLANYPVPPFRAAFVWNDRQWLLGTELESEAWHSKQFSSGISPEFVPIMKVTTYGGTGPLKAGGVLSSDYAVLFKRDAVFAVAGAGPDDTGGGGSFQVRRLPWDGGCENHASVVTYPGGLLFQGIDGKIYRVTAGLAVDDPGYDAQDYAGLTVNRAIHLPKYREVRFYMTGGKILVLDYGNANENAPNGYWYVDESSAWGAATGATVLDDLAQFVDSTGVVWKEVAAQYFDATDTTIATKCDVNTLQLADLGGELSITRIFFYGEWHSLHDLRVAVAADGGTATNYDEDSITGSPEVFMLRPEGCGRISALDISVERTGTGAGQGFSFDGLVIEVQAKGRAKRVNSGQRI